MFVQKESLYSCLTSRKIAGKEYEHDLNGWNAFEMNSINDYQDLNLKCDVLLLADALEKCKNSNLRNYGLFLTRYLSAPGLS